MYSFRVLLQTSGFAAGPFVAIKPRPLINSETFKIKLMVNFLSSFECTMMEISIIIILKYVRRSHT